MPRVAPSCREGCGGNRQRGGPHDPIPHPRHGIAGQPLTFAARGKTLCTATTDASGTAACASPSALFTALVSALFGGRYQAAYAGSAGYLPSQASAGLS